MSVFRSSREPDVSDNTAKARKAVYSIDAKGFRLRIASKSRDHSMHLDPARSRPFTFG
jgi:hypothetical protein